MIPLELILSKIPDFGKCRACGAAEKTRRSGAAEFLPRPLLPPRPRFGGRIFRQGLTSI